MTAMPPRQRRRCGPCGGRPSLVLCLLRMITLRYGVFLIVIEVEREVKTCSRCRVREGGGRVFGDISLHLLWLWNDGKNGGYCACRGHVRARTRKGPVGKV